MPNLTGRIGGPIDPDPPPDPSHLLALLQSPTTEARDDGLVIRGQFRGLAIVHGYWMATVDGKIRIDAETVKALRAPGVFIDRLWLVIGADRFELVPFESNGVAWATIGGPIDPDAQAGA